MSLLRHFAATRFPVAKFWNRSRRKCVTRSCHRSMTCATNPIMRIRFATRHHSRSQKKSMSSDLMSHLFSTTSLERTARVNMNIIGLERPADGMFNLARTAHRMDASSARNTVKRRLQHQICRSSRIGCTFSTACLIAYLSIDEVISDHSPVRMSPSRRSHEEVQAVGHIQAEAILNLRLRNLAQTRRDENPERAG